jgi:uncharacterized membrane protein YdbT with pleckstrin-like domain
VSDRIIRPTSKFLKAGAILLAAVVAGLEIAYFAKMRDERDLDALAAVLPLVLLWPAVRWMRRRFTKAVVAGDRLRYETGLASKSTRNIHLMKIQDVRVDQTVIQRMFSVGDLSIETAGESSRLVISNIDDPQQVADELMTLSHQGATGA